MEKMIKYDMVVDVRVGGVGISFRKNKLDEDNIRDDNGATRIDNLGRGKPNEVTEYDLRVLGNALTRSSKDMLANRYWLILRTLNY